MRLFVALDIDESVRQRLSTFLAGVEGFATAVRWVKPEALHITLKFIGEWEADRLPALQQALAAVRSLPVELTVGDYGFFPTARSARVFWVGIQPEPALADLAKTVDQACAGIGIPREQRAFSPHLTLARGKSAAPGPIAGDRANTSFAQLQQKLSAMPAPEFGTMTARDFYLFESKTSPSGARYTKLSRFALSG
jgi:RNA 2',3'-cyclic 3'-phosphodiesterase